MDSLSAEWIFPVTSPPLRQHTIEIRNGAISKIRPSQRSDTILPETCIIPGLINSHTHLAYTALRNLFDDLDFFPWIRKITETKYQKMSENDVAVSTRLGINECLRAGITTVADMCDFEVALKTLSESPLRGAFYWEIFGVEKEHAAKTWSDLQQIYPSLKSKYQTDRLKVGLSPHAVYTVRPELYSDIAQMAVREKIPISFHVAESREEEEFIGSRSGVIQKFLEKRALDWKILGNSSIAHLAKTGIFETKPLLAHLVQASSQDMDILQNYKISIAHCPKSNAKFAHGIAPITKLINRGFRVCLGTDSAASNNRLDLFEEARFALLQQRNLEQRHAVSEQQLLEMMTIRGAEALGMEKEVGSLEIGKQADLVAVNVPGFYADSSQMLHHLIHNCTAADVTKTIISGNEVSRSDPDPGIRALYEKLGAE
jgi:cytosine/adenosine deaminase-related metal-dependent hydrolase